MAGNSNGTFFALFSRYAKPRHVPYGPSMMYTTRNLPQLVSIGFSKKYTKFKCISSKYPVYFAENQPQKVYGGFFGGFSGRSPAVHYWRTTRYLKKNYICGPESSKFMYIFFNRTAGSLKLQILLDLFWIPRQVNET